MISRDSADSIRSADSRRRSMPMVALEALLKPIQDPRNAVVSTPEPKVPGEQSGSSSDSEAEPSISEQPQDVRITWTVDEDSTLLDRQYAFEKGEKLVHVSEDSHWVTPLQQTKGRIELSTIHLYFYSDEEDSNEAADEISSWVNSGSLRKSKQVDHEKSMMRWRLDELETVYGRRYLLNTALELFFKDRKNIFIAFASPKERDDFFRLLSCLHPPKLAASLDPKRNFSVSGVMDDWVNQRISNFDYLMKLNTIAGRSYNDITQYPVFRPQRLYVRKARFE